MQSPEGLTQAVRIDARIPASKNRIVGNKDEKVTLPEHRRNVTVTGSCNAAGSCNFSTQC
jgi:hypothetical protein